MFCVICEGFLLRATWTKCSFLRSMSFFFFFWCERNPLPISVVSRKWCVWRRSFHSSLRRMPWKTWTTSLQVRKTGHAVGVQPSSQNLHSFFKRQPQRSLEELFGNESPKVVFWKEGKEEEQDRVGSRWRKARWCYPRGVGHRLRKELDYFRTPSWHSSTLPKACWKAQPNRPREGYVFILFSSPKDMDFVSYIVIQHNSDLHTATLVLKWGSTFTKLTTWSSKASTCWIKWTRTSTHSLWEWGSFISFCWKNQFFVASEHDLN